MFFIIGEHVHFDKIIIVTMAVKLKLSEVEQLGRRKRIIFLVK